MRGLFKMEDFAAHFFRLVIDETHCVLDWESFRPEYKNFDLFLHAMPPHARVLCASATVNNRQRLAIMKHFQMRPEDTELIRLNND